MRVRILGILAIALTVVAPLSLAQAPVDRPPITDSEGKKLYQFLLNEDAVRAIDASREPPARDPADPANKEDFRGWHDPRVQKVVRDLEATHGVTAVSMTSFAVPTFSAYVQDGSLESLRGDPNVHSGRPVWESNVSFSAWADIPGGETIPWGKIAVGTNDAVTTGTWTYMLDGGGAAHNELGSVDRTTSPVNASYTFAFNHANHVAGIMAATMSDGGVRGVNPGAPVISVNRGAGIYTEIQTAIDWVLAHSEASGVFGVANLSTNGIDLSCGGVLTPWLRMLSSRMLVVQSAGNNLQDAGFDAYCDTSSYDGILVVGGLNENGAQGSPYNNAVISSYQLGSNHGTKVEVWGPSTNVLSTWIGSWTETQLLSGTSMAAPHIAALAARHGSHRTTPYQREAYIRARLQATGFNDTSGNPIRIASYLQPPSFVVPSHLLHATPSASTTLAGSSAAYTLDRKYRSGALVWNSGGVAPAWIEYDFGYPRTLTNIRLTPEQFPGGMATHQIYAGNTWPPSTLVATVSASSQSGESLSAALAGVQARFLRVRTTSSQSWVAWREVEIYADLRADLIALDAFFLGLLNRAGDVSGYAYWLNSIRVVRCNAPSLIQANLDSITYQFVNSAEFISRGLSNADYVTAMYEGVFRRAPDPAGHAYWTNELNTASKTREQVRAGFVYSSEFSVYTVAPIAAEPCTTV